MRLFASINRAPRSAGDHAYEQAMAASDDVLNHMRRAPPSTVPARSVIADIWAQRRNVPFMATVIEAVEEMKSPLQQSRDS